MHAILSLISALTILFQSADSSGKIDSKFYSIINEIPTSTKSSIFIYNPATADTLYQSNVKKSMIPASNTKLFTTAAALNLMGPAFRLKTSLLSEDYNLTDGTINGNLYIKGFGNSLFTEKDLDSLVNNLKNLGIKNITGDIIGDDTYFDDLYSRDDWITDERANVTLPPVSALVIDRNKMILTLHANKNVGENLGYNISPETPFTDVSISAKVTKFRAHPRISASFNENKLTINVTGGLRKSSRSKSYAVFVNDPPRFAAFLLYGKLLKNGIMIEGKTGKGKTPFDVSEINNSSVSLLTVLSLTNKNSDNYLAECLFKALGAYYKGEQGNSFYATQAVLTFIDQKDIYTDGTAVVDGSGISRYNEITTGAIVGLLEKIYYDELLFNDFYNTLSILGEDGTLEKRLRRTAAERNFRGKTGTLNGVTALSGYLTTSRGEDLIISIIMEFKVNGSGYHKDIQDKIILYLYENL
ncbi:MAG: D-alanyl-D-alanine carboxypeptidase/D-alanyl-D-alanine-endopeptidase [Bacteroidetes bacterium]|nr:D-alanyl-D-alanine carboxypeptidase/D-alanyl-D-alanine-endopeptidase [Bacteroidota bacterium]